MPIDPAFFRDHSALYKKVGDSNELIKAEGVTAEDLLANSSAEHFLDRGAVDIQHGSMFPNEATAMHTANRTDAANFVFLQYWFFYDASKGPSSLAADPYHEGDVEFAQAAIQLTAPVWKVGQAYKQHAAVLYGDNAYVALSDHTSTSGNAPGTDATWQKTAAKSCWFLPFAAHTGQHYYGQTVEWRLNDGSAAASPQTQTWVQHDNVNERFKVFIAAGTHATYFAAGTYVVGITEANTRLGSQIQYRTPTVADALTETAGATEQMIGVWKYPDLDFETWTGHWGYKNTAQGAAFSATDRDGPQGPAIRFSLDADGNKVTVRTSPKRLHNAALRPVDTHLIID